MRLCTAGVVVDFMPTCPMLDDLVAYIVVEILNSTKLGICGIALDRNHIPIRIPRSASPHV